MVRIKTARSKGARILPKGGQNSQHGARTTPPRSRTGRPPVGAAAPSAAADIGAMQALAQKSGAKADRDLAKAIEEAYDNNKVSVDANQQDLDTQRFFNAIGWTSRKPTVVADEKELAAMKAAGQLQGEYLYHTDDAYRDPMTGKVIDGQTFANQYMGAGRQFLSAGIYGDGTYFSNRALITSRRSWSQGSWGYGRRDQAYQFKGALKNDGSVRMIDASDLDKRIATFRRSHPNAALAIDTMSIGKNGGNKGVYAALFGFNTVRNPWGNGEYYYTVLDRSTTIVARQGISRADAHTKSGNWRKNGGWKIP